jgi:hypothetical protein
VSFQRRLQGAGESDSARETGTDQPAAGPAAPGGTLAGQGLPSDRIWIVEGTKEDVEVMLRRLAAFADAGGMRLRTGEAKGLPPLLPSPEASIEPSRDKKDKSAVGKVAPPATADDDESANKRTANDPAESRVAGNGQAGQVASPRTRLVLQFRFAR